MIDYESAWEELKFILTEALGMVYKDILNKMNRLETKHEHL